MRPLLAGPAAERARAALHAIAAELPAAKVLGFDLDRGAAGVALFYAALDAAQPREELRDHATDFLNRALEGAAANPKVPWLGHGFAGPAWTAAHLQDLWGDEEDAIEDADDVLLSLLRRPGWTHEYDLLAGLVGLGVYALERLPREKAREAASRAVIHLDQLAAPDRGGLTWYTPPAWLGWKDLEAFPDREHITCLGLAHGVPCAISFLSRAYAKGIERERAKRLVEGAVRWLLAEPQHDGKTAGFACWSAPGHVQDTARLAWCYGDPGVAVSLLAAARAFGVSEWEARAVDVARRAARRPREEAGVLEPGLCHGAAGLGHLFHRAYQATGDAGLGDAARSWLGVALEQLVPGSGVGGVVGPRVPGIETDRDHAGLLYGAAGVGLVLASAIDERVPAWDRVLLMDAP